MKDFTDIIIAPVITEKSMQNQTGNVYTFKVVKTANKTQIKQAVENLFNVKVKSVNTLNTKAKKKRVGKHSGMTKTYKKAIVTLVDGASIEL